MLTLLFPSRKTVKVIYLHVYSSLDLAIALFLLSNNPLDALEICFSRIKDLDLGLTLLRLSTGIVFVRYFDFFAECRTFQRDMYHQYIQNSESIQPLIKSVISSMFFGNDIVHSMEVSFFYLYTFCRILI